MGIFRNRCSVRDRLTKKTLLALIKAPSTIPITVGEIVEYVDESGRTGNYRVSSVKGENLVLETDTDLIEVPRSSVKTNDPKCILDQIPESNWEITSFDAKSKVACVTVTTNSGTRTLSITVPGF